MLGTGSVYSLSKLDKKPSQVPFNALKTLLCCSRTRSEGCETFHPRLDWKCFSDNSGARSRLEPAAEFPYTEAGKH